jgi:hypothetical protein
MKKIAFLLIIVSLVSGCKKQEFEPEGPTDVRVKNLSTVPWTNVIVNTSGGEHNLGNIAAQSNSAYVRFDKAYPFAEITATINGLVYTTGPVNYSGQTYMGQMKITYEVYIKSDANRVLEISKTVPDAPLD